MLDNPCISFETLREVIHNNPGLESLCIIRELIRYNQSTSLFLATNATEILRIYPFDEVMKLIGAASMNQLKEFAYSPLYYEGIDFQIKRHTNHMQIVDAFVDSLKHLESFALSFKEANYFTDVIELLHRLASQCKNIKHLKLYHIDGGYDEIFEAIQSFKCIENLVIATYDLQGDSIASLVEHLPFLCHLHIRVYPCRVGWEIILKVLSNCPSLEKLTIVSDLDCDFETLATAQFFYSFIDCIQIRNVTIEVKSDQIIGTITKNQIVWRNRVVRWMGFAANKFNGLG